jgi:site-specific recombinase XerD
MVFDDNCCHSLTFKVNQKELNQMESRNTYSVTFITRTSKMKGGEAPIYCRITVDSRRAEISIKKGVRPEDWTKTGKVKGNTENARSLNAYIKQIEAKIFEHYRELLAKNKLPTAEALRNAYLGTDDKGHSLLNLIEYHNTELKDTIEWGTMKNYMTTQKYVAMFLKEKLKTSDVFLSQLSYKFLADFEMYLRRHQPKDHHKPCGNNTVMKHIERLRKMINLAIRNEWLEKDPFAKFKQSFTKSDREYLTKEELETIELKEFKISRLQQVKDLFVFSCYTGLSYIDVMQLSRTNISIGIDGEYWLYTSRQKTDSSVRIPLLPIALEMIEKYKDHPVALFKGTLFPNISNQKLNSYLKEIADLCHLEKNLTFHLARHTFATTVTLTNGVPIETVSKLLGHSSIRTTQIYAKVVEIKVSQDMKLLREKIRNNITITKTGT